MEECIPGKALRFQSSDISLVNSTLVKKIYVTSNLLNTQGYNWFATHSLPDCCVTSHHIKHSMEWSRYCIKWCIGKPNILVQSIIFYNLYSNLVDRHSFGKRIIVIGYLTTMMDFWFRSMTVSFTYCVTCIGLEIVIQQFITRWWIGG
jgi:hypothetical protein